MFSGAQIRQFQDDAARRAARSKKQPYVLWDEAEVDRLGEGPIRFPFVGGYIADGWEAVLDADEDPLQLFVDSSGFGAEGEPALTLAGFRRELKRLLREHAGQTLGFAVVQAGQFQVYVGVFAKKGA